MANTKISALPTWSGTAADLRFFVMNNSGNTETFKFSGYTSQLIPGPGTNSYRTINSGAANVNSPAEDIIIGNGAKTSSGAGGIAIGKNATAGGIIRKAVAIGQDVSATGTGIIVGYDGSANGDGACAFGILNTASAESSTAVGVLAVCSGVHAVAIGRDVNATGLRSIAIAPNTTVSRENSCAVGGNAHSVSNGKRQSIFGGVSNTISSSNELNTILGGNGNTIGSTTSGSTIIGHTSYTATRNDAVFVQNLVVTNYSNLNYVDDTAAAAGGVVLGQVYHNAGALRIRVV